MKKKIYSYQINFLSDRNGYTATVPALPGCISFGETLDEARKNIKEAIKLHLECLKTHKKQIPDSADKKPFYTTFIQVSIPYA